AQRQIADGIEQLVAHEVVLVAQTARIDHAVFIHGNGIVEAGTQGIAGLAQNLGVARKTESTGAGDVFEIAARSPVENPALAAYDLGVEVNFKVQRAAVIGLERGKSI